MTSVSEWDEPPAEIDGLTLFDLHREPRLPVDGGAVGTGAVAHPNLTSTINSELTCPVCLGILRNTMIIHTCLHRFCSECIQKCLRVGKNECPSCRAHVPSRRSLRPDSTFDAIISRIYPNLSEYERLEEEAFTKTRTASQLAPGVLEQQQQRRKKRPSSGSASSPSAVADAGSTRPPKRRTSNGSRDQAAGGGAKRTPAPAAQPAPAALPRNEAEEQVNFVLRRHPKETSVSALEREYLRTSVELKVYHMKKFLGLKLSCNTFHNFEIIVVAGDKGVILDEGLTLEDVCQHFWDRRSDLVLYFRMAKE